MIVVTGATGNVGRPLVNELLRRGARVRAISRHAGEARLPAEVDVRAGDPRAPQASWFDGASAVWVNPRSVGPAVAELLTLARNAGVARAVALSATNVDEDLTRQPSRFRGDLNTETERAVMQSGLAWVSLRPGMFCSNFVGLWGGQLRQGDVVHGPYGAAQLAPIDERDIAAVGARALLDDDLLGEHLIITGPASSAQTDLLSDLGRALHRPLRYVEVPVEVARRGMLDQGFPPGFVDGYLNLQREWTLGPALTTPTVERVLGRPAIPFASWAADHAGAFGRARVATAAG
jgi:uncharacterized protein YbjT (DUF2867 family)